MKSFPSYWKIALRGTVVGFVVVLFLVAIVTLAAMVLSGMYPAPLPRLGGDKTPDIVEMAVFVGGLIALTYGAGIGLLASTLMWLYFRHMPQRWTRYTGWSGGLCGLVAVALVAIPQGVQNIVREQNLNAMRPYLQPTNLLTMSFEYVLIWSFPAVLVAGVGAWAALRYFDLPMGEHELDPMISASGTVVQPPDQIPSMPPDTTQ